MLSSSGYKALGFSGDQIPDDARFRLGMKHDDVRNWLHDPHGTEWEQGFQGQIDALVILAHDLNPNEDNAFKDLVAHISQEAETVADIVNTEYGHVIRETVDDETGRTRTTEHFGYVDGISQPRFYNYHVAKAGGLKGWDPSAPLKLVLSVDPNGHGPDSFGSYFVYRKLQQDVDGFNRRVGELAAALKIDEDLAGAYVVGRFKNGTPVVKYRESRKKTAYQSRLEENDFSYAIDPMGDKCPYQAHIRKANPRGEKPMAMMSWTARFIAKRKWLRRLFPEVQERLEMGLRMERDRRIARRGIPYGPDHSERGERGLLFLCAQSDIAAQYEFLQAVWCNKNIFLKDETGLDPVIGQGYQQLGGQWWPKKWGGPQWPARWERPQWPPWRRNLSRRMTRLTRNQFDFSGYVTLKGGEYFFAPSMDFLKNI
jgi:Dyp-type peroxidase family